jgi:hypothetical protein
MDAAFPLCRWNSLPAHAAALVLEGSSGSFACDTGDYEART